MLQEILDDLGFSDWEAEGDEGLICPCGYTIEIDGKCPKGHVSPLLQFGVI